MQFKTLDAALRYVGGISTTSKMPCPSYGLSAHQCITGARLAEIEGSTCSDCYALKGFYGDWNKNLHHAHAQRAASLYQPLWVDAMVFIITRKKLDYFRWHDSGDIQSFQHLLNIVSVAEKCPGTKFWMPTREKKFIFQYTETFGDFPKNLIVRVSATMMDTPASPEFKNTSTVHRDKKPIGFTCLSSKQEGKCLDCRECWNPKRKNVSYAYH
jgi:hypothetical protein